MTEPRKAAAYRLAIPALALLAFGAMAALWVAGSPAYFGVLRGLGVHAFSFPFLDAHAVLSAAECQRQGVDVYATNPCDVLGRPHVYSPLWLSIVPSWPGTAALDAVGLILDFAFIASLGFVFRPRRGREVGLYAVAVFSPVVVFAVERANNDVPVFLAVVAAAALWNAAPRSRLCAYATCLAMALLKYYPMVLLVLVARERLRRALVVAFGAAVALLLFGWQYRAEIGPALANIPKLSPFADAFSALNLPYGLSALVEGSAGWQRNPIAMALLAGLITGCLLAVRPNIARLAALPIDWTGWELRCVGFAAVLLPACFFAGQNLAYRGVYLLLLLPGLFQLQRSAPSQPVRRWLGLVIAAVYFVLWEACLRHLVDLRAVDESATIALWLALWLVRELVWWWLVGALLTLAALCLRSLPLPGELLGLLRRPSAGFRGPEPATAGPKAGPD